MLSVVGVFGVTVGVFGVTVVVGKALCTARLLNVSGGGVGFGCSLSGLKEFGVLYIDVPMGTTFVLEAVGGKAFMQTPAAPEGENRASMESSTPISSGSGFLPKHRERASGTTIVAPALYLCVKSKLHMSSCQRQSFLCKFGWSLKCSNDWWSL